MNVRLALSTTLLVLAAGCEATRDITSNPGNRTDFIAGETYRLKQPVFLFKHDKNDPKGTPALAELGFSGTPKDLSEFRSQASANPQVAGLLMPGELVRVTKFIEDKSLTLGTFLEVFAVVTSGTHKNSVVELQLIAKKGYLPSQAFVDPAYLEPSGTESK